MKALDVLTKDFKEKLSSGELVSIEWPTMEKAGIEVFCRPHNVGQRVTNVQKAMQNGTFALCMEAVINFALDEDGQHLFKNGDRDALMKKCDSEEIITAGILICSVALPQDDDYDASEQNLAAEHDVALKNSKQTKTLP